MIGTRLLHYEITEKLGEGGMGVVYKARDTHLDRFVALKVLPPEKVADAGRKARFVQEAKAASALNHPNIVTIHDISSEAGVDFIVMELVEGRTLDQMIPRKGMRVGEVLKLAVQMADALARAHGAGIIHRDLKPANVMVDGHGVVKVLDFGLAKLTEQTVSDDDRTVTMGIRTEEGAIVGTTPYMSPEQAEGKPVDARSDIFSLGALLYEMLSGCRAFEGDSKLSTLSAVLHREPAPLGAEIPQELQRVITRCLRKDPARRFHHCIDVKVALEDLKEESDSGAFTGSSGADPKHAPKWVWTAGGIGLLAVVGTAAWLTWSPRRAEAPMKVISFTNLPGAAFSPALSPDGERIAFVWNGPNEDNQDIYVQLIGADRPLRLTTDPADDFAPVWSPNGRDIAFQRKGANWLTTLQVSYLGGNERPLFQSKRTPLGRIAVFGWDRISAGVSWHPDGRRIAISNHDRPDDSRRIILVDIETGDRKNLTSPPQVDGPGDGHPVFSPDGTKLAFFRGAGPETLTLCLLHLNADGTPQGEPETVLKDEQTLRGMDWMPDGESIIFSSTRGGAQSLWRVKVPSNGDAGEPERLTVGSDRALFPSVSRQGNRMAFTQGEAAIDIWRVPGPGASRPGLPGRLLKRSFYADFSPDGKRIAYSSGASGTEGVYVCDGEGKDPAPWTHMGGARISYPRWSPDGKRIAFRSDKDGGVFHIYVMEEGGANLRQVTSGRFGALLSDWSADGKFLYFHSTRTGKSQVWKAPTSGGEPVQVTQNGGYIGVESADGRFLYYTKRLADSIWRMPAGGGREEVVLSDSRISLRWALASGAIYVMDPVEDGGSRFRRFDLATGQMKVVAILPPAHRPHMFPAISPTEDWLLFPQYERFEFNIALVENFR